MRAQVPTLENLVKKLDSVIADVAAAKLHETVSLLNIARLDLILRAYNFTEEELDTFLSELREKTHDRTDESLDASSQLVGRSGSLLI